MVGFKSKTYHLPTKTESICFYIEDVSGNGGTLTVDTSHSDATNIEYSLDGNNWTSTKPSIPANGRVYIRANATYWSDNSLFSAQLYSDNDFNVGGNIMSLLYGSNFTGNETTFPDNVEGLFRGFLWNTKIVSAEKLSLPATTLTNSCYYEMFRDCNRLITPPLILPATTLARHCYCMMFWDCDNLLTSPTLPATTLVESCYQYMFMRSEHVSTIKCLAENMSANNCTYRWLNSASATGTFYKSTNATWPTGESGIPSGWTVVDV